MTSTRCHVILFVASLVFLVFGSVFAGIPVASAHNTSRADLALLGRLDMNGYCVGQGYTYARTTGDVPVCFKETPEHFSIDMSAACNWEYQRTDLVARNPDDTNIHGWNCYDPQVTVIGAVTDLQGYCQSIGDAGVNTNPANANDWHCIKYETLVIDLNAACQWQFKWPNAIEKEDLCYAQVTPTPQPASQPSTQPTPPPAQTTNANPAPTQTTAQSTSQTSPASLVRNDYVTACTQTNYGGSCYRFGVGKYAGLTTNYVSFWIPCDLTLGVNTGTTFDGNPGVFNQNTPDLSQANLGGAVHSLKVEARTDCTPTGSLDPPTQHITQPTRSDYVTACTGTNYTGSCDKFPLGQYLSLSKSYVSFWILCDLTLGVNTGNNFDGNPGTFNANIADVSQAKLGGAIHSLKVEARTNCTPPGPFDPPTQVAASSVPTSASATSSSGSGNHIPGGVWVYPDSGFTFVQGNAYTIVVRGFPLNPGDPDIAYVNVTGFWSGTWHVLCHIPNDRPDLGDHYYCTTDLKVNGSYPPNGPITLSFDVYNKAGDVNNAPNGEHTGTFLTSNSTMVHGMTYYPAPLPSSTNDAVGQIDPHIILASECLLEPAFKVVKVIGIVGHTFEIAERFYKFTDNGMKAWTVIQDIQTGDRMAVLIDAGKFVPYSSCFELIHDLTPIEPAS